MGIDTEVRGAGRCYSELMWYRSNLTAGLLWQTVDVPFILHTLALERTDWSSMSSARPPWVDSLKHVGE